MQILLVALGSSLGGLARWGVSLAFARLLGTAFPWGTLFINLSGACFLGWLMTLLSDRLLLADSTWLRADDVRLMLAVGFTGAYTTFSTFEYEANSLLSAGETLSASAYVGLSVFLGLLAVRLGAGLARLS